MRVMYRFLATPKWLAGIALAAAGVVLFVNLGFWQLSRLEERRTHNATLAERGEQPTVDGGQLMGDDPDDLAFRRISLVGTFEPAREVLLTPRSLDGRAGHHVLTPLRTEEGLVIVDRGWVPLGASEPPVAAAAPPDGDVRVDGLLLAGAEAGRAGTFDGRQGLEFVNAPDLGRLEGWLGEPVAPLYVLARTQEPPGPHDLPVRGQPPVIAEGNHFSYAVQWFAFAGVVLVGFPILVRRTARDRRDAEDAGEPRPQAHATT